MSYFGTIYADTELPSRARAVYMYLRDRADSEGKCWPGIKNDCVRHAIVTLHGQTGIDGSGATWIPAKDPTLP